MLKGNRPDTLCRNQTPGETSRHVNAWLRKAFLGWLSWAAVVLFVALPVSADETLLMQAAKKWEAAELTEAAKQIGRAHV